MEEKKELKKPNTRKKKETSKVLKEKVTKAEELKFGFLEVIILIFITALVTVIVTITIDKVNRKESNVKLYNSDLERFANEYSFILNKYYGEVDSKVLINNAIAGMVNNLDDPYSTFINVDDATNFDVELDGEFLGLGVEITVNANNEIEVYNVLDGYEAKNSGIQVGDVITHMDGESIANLSTVEFRSRMIENNKEVVTLTVKRNNETMDISIKRTLVQIPSVTKEVYTSGISKVGYIGISIFAGNTYKQFKEALTELEAEDIDSLIVDVRSNSGGHLSVVTDIISEFLDSTHVIYQVKDSSGVTKEYSKGNVNRAYNMVVLIDGASASASELLASALKEQSHATLVGTKSFGKSTVQQVVDLENGSKYKITIKEWLTSEGNVINGNGLIPDIEVLLDEAYFDDPKTENDNQLQEALNILKK